MIKIPDQKLRQLLVTDGVVTEDQFDSSVLKSKRLSISVAEILLGENLITEEYYYNLVSKFYGIDLARLNEKKIDESVLRLLSEDLARQKRVILFSREMDGSLLAAMDDPNDLLTIEFLEGHLHAKIKPYLASKDDLNRGFSMYGKKISEDFRKTIQDNIQATLKSKVNEKGSKEAAEELPVIALTDNIMTYAISSRASDIHIEVLETEVLIRFRIDGILHEIVRVQREIYQALVARFKLLSGLKLDEHYRPQDGRFRYQIGNDYVDVRVSVIPTFYGEKVQMRLLASNSRPLSFEELGFLPDMIKIIKDNIAKTYGMILVTGPTGSGKTTTLYSIMSAINKPEINIVSIEDPVEYYMKYVNQIQVNPAAGITFANGLRAILRQDPNVVMVGEIRDEETVDISVNAALTGHLVLSSLHTNDAPTAIPRILDLKVPQFLVAAVLNIVMAQRLVRKLCVNCITSYKMSDTDQEFIKAEINSVNPEALYKIPKTMFKGRGCQTCSNTGFKGRIGIYEILNITEDLRRYIAEKDFTLQGLKAIARKAGFITMFEDGLRKVERGMTTLDEVLRVIRE